MVRHVLWVKVWKVGSPRVAKVGGSPVYPEKTFLYINGAFVRAIFIWPWKMVSVTVLICFISQWMKRSQHGLFVFPPKKTLIWGRYCSIGQSCYSMMSKQRIGWFLESSSGMHGVFSPERSLNQPKATHVYIRSINQSNRSISVRLLFLLCSGVFISRSYENRSREIFFQLQRSLGSGVWVP